VTLDGIEIQKGKSPKR